MSHRSNDANPSSTTKQKKKSNKSNHNDPNDDASASASASASSPCVSILDSPGADPSAALDLASASASIHPLSTSAVDFVTAAPPRTFVASTFKPVSAINSVTSTISALSHHANRGFNNLIAAHSNSTVPTSPSPANATPLRSDGSISPIYDAFLNAPSPPHPAQIHAALHQAHHTDHATAPRLLWSRWDRLPFQHNPTKSAPLLISYFDDGSLQALLVHHRTISELLCLPNAADVLLNPSTSVPSSKPSLLLTALVRPPTADLTDPQLLLVVQPSDKAPCLLAYSLTAHQVQASVQLPHPSRSVPVPAQHTDQRRDLLWPQVQAQCNHHYLVLSFAAPPSIHVLSTSTLHYLYPPILDVSAASLERPVPISLSHRLLAFACTPSDHVSPIRSDVRRFSNATYHDLSYSSATIHSDNPARLGEMRDNLFETSAHVGDAARRIRGGVINGVRNLGEWGSSYWPQAASPPTAAPFVPSQPSLLSQSAPHSAPHPLRQASSASTSPMLSAADAGRAAKRLSTGATALADVAAAAAATAASVQSAHNPHARCVRVIDLASDARTLCTFAPSSHAVTLVSFSPCGRLLLTADALGHAFHVFELPLSGTFGNSTTSASSSAVWHRYKLLRGITTADVVNAQWTPDSQWIAVGTHSGTVHIYAVNPFGGVPSIANHVQAKIRNPYTLQPLGLSLSSLARSVRPSPPPLPQQELLSRPPSRVGPDITSTTAAETQKLAPPSFLLVPHPSPTSHSDGHVCSPFELLTSDTRILGVTLHAVRCWSTQTYASGVGNASQDAADSKRCLVASTSPRTSGLSQMMRKAGEGLLNHQQAPRLLAECVRVALWQHIAPQAGSVTKLSVAALADQLGASRSLDASNVSLATPLASVAKAEIETYSQSPAMLPSSIFLSRQTFFHARTCNLKSASPAAQQAERLRCIQRRASRPIQVRRTARIVSREPSSEGPSSFDDSLAVALDQMSFDPEHLPPRSASAHIPSFPQGQRARSAGWPTGSSIPIRIVAGGLGGIYRAGKELGRGVDIAKRRTSGASGTAPQQESANLSRNTASISFDAGDDVDLLGEHDDLDRSNRPAYRSDAHIEHGSNRSDVSLLSVLRNDEPCRGSQPSSAETPSTRFSEAEDASADVDECDWDAIEASRSPAAAGAPLFEAVDMPQGQHVNKKQTQGSNSMDDDFTVGMFEEDSDTAATMQSRSSLSPAQEVKCKATTAKELVYALPAGGSTRSSLLSHSGGLTTTADSRVERKVVRESSPSNSEGSGDSASQASTGSGMLCEGSKETHTYDDQPSTADAEANKDAVDATGMPTVISTSGGAKKKKRKGGR